MAFHQNIYQELALNAVMRVAFIKNNLSFTVSESGSFFSFHPLVKRKPIKPLLSTHRIFFLHQLSRLS